MGYFNKVIRNGGNIFTRCETLVWICQTRTQDFYTKNPTAPLPSLNANTPVYPSLPKTSNSQNPPNPQPHPLQNKPHRHPNASNKHPTRTAVPQNGRAGFDIRRRKAEIPSANIRQQAVLVQHRDVRADVALVASERAEVAVAGDVVEAVEVLGRLVEEGLRVRQIRVIEGVLRDPDREVRVAN